MNVKVGGRGEKDSDHLPFAKSICPSFLSQVQFSQELLPYNQ